jgi:hypothetical protein
MKTWILAKGRAKPKICPHPQSFWTKRINTEKKDVYLILRSKIKLA